MVDFFIEKNFFKLLDGVSAAIFLVSENSELLYCNKKAEENFGIKFVLGNKKQQDTTNNFFATTLKEKIKKIDETGYTSFFWRKEKDDIELGINLMKVRIDGVARYLGIFSETKEQAMTVKQAKHDESRFRVLFDIAPAICTLWSEDIELVLCNEFAASFFEFNSKEEYLANFDTISPPTQPCGTPSDKKAIEYVLEGFEKGHVEFFWMHQLPKSKTPVPSTITLTRIEIDGKKHLMGFGVDQRPAFLREEIIKEERTRFEAFFNNMPTPGMMWNKDTSFRMCNPAALKLFGVKDTDYFFDNYDSFLPSVQPCGTASVQLVDDFENAALAQGYYSFDWVYHIPSTGEFVPVSVEVTRTEIDGHPTLLAFLQDKREQMERELIYQLQLDRMNSIFAHIPTPMQLWDAEHRVIFANRAMAALFNETNTEKYVQNHYATYLKFQPDGQNSLDLSNATIAEAFKNGTSQVEWMHSNFEQNEQIPMRCELVRIEYGGKDVVMELCFDLREEKAREREHEMQIARFNAVLDHSPTTVHIWAEDKTLNFVNSAVLDFYGADDLQDYVKNLAKTFPHMQPYGVESTQLFYAALDVALESGSNQLSWIAIDAYGDEVPLKCSMISIEYGGERAIVVFAYDMRQELMEIEERQEIEQKLTAYLENMPIAATILTRDLNILETNTACLRLFGYDTKDDYQKNFTKTFPEYQENGLKTMDFFSQKVTEATKVPRVEFECMFLTKSGNDLPAKITTITTELRGRSVVIAFLQDMRAYHMLSSEHRLMQERLRAMLEASPSCCLIIDIEGKVLDCNNLALSFFEVSDLEALNAHAPKMHSKEQKGSAGNKETIHDILKNIFEHPDTNFEWVFQTSKGEKIPTHVSTNSMSLGGRSVAVLYLKDMRENLQLVQEKKRSQELVYAMINLSPIACLVTDEDQKLIEANKMALNLFGARDVEEIDFNYGKFCPDGGCERKSICGGSIEDMLKRNDGKLSEDFNRVCRLETIEGSIPVELSGRHVVLGGQSCFVMYIRDMREAIRAEEERQKSHARVVAMLNSSPVASFVINPLFDIIISNFAAREFFGVELDSTVSDHGGIFQFLPRNQPDGTPSRQKLAALFTETFRTKKDIELEWMWRGLDGEQLPAQISFKIIELEGANHLIGHVRDLRQLRKVVETADALEKMVYADPLTGAYNRHYFAIESTKIYKECQDMGREYSVLMIDIDNFKTVNDTHTHKVGDEVLKILVERANTVLRKTDSVVRYGGEEFVITMPKTGMEEAKIVAHRIKQSVVNAPFKTSQVNLPITLSIGIASKDEYTPEKPHDAIDTLVHHADQAMYKSKKTGKNQILAYENGEITKVEYPLGGGGSEPTKKEYRER